MSALRLLPLALPLLIGCQKGESSSDPGGSTDPVDPCGDATCATDENMVSCPADCEAAVPDGTTLTLDSCVDGLSQPDIDETLAVVTDMENSYHEMVACGALVYQLISGLVEIFVDVITDISSVSTPDGFTYADGLYHAATDDGSVSMDVAFFWGRDYALNAEGDPVADDLFTINNYLENLSVEVDYLAWELLIHYDATGPLVELLGQRADPPNPIAIGLDDLDDLGRDLYNLDLSTTIDVEDPRDASVIIFHLGSPLAQVESLLTGGQLALEHLSSSAVNDSIGQSVDAADWAVDYVDGSNALDGTIGFDAVGGAFDFDGVFTYNTSAWPTVELSCAP